MNKNYEALTIKHRIASKQIEDAGTAGRQ